MRRFLVRLYPADWQARYGDEFEALLGERPLGPFDVVDVFLSAVDAHIRPRGAAAADDHTRGVQMTLRTGGIAAVVGGVLWLVSLAGASASGGGPWAAVFAIALLALIVAMIGLSASSRRRGPVVMWIVVAIPVVGSLLALVGGVGMALVGDGPFIAGASAWNMWGLGLVTMIIGSGLFALAALRGGTLSRAGAALLAIAAVASLPLLFGIAMVNAPSDVANVLAIIAICAFSAGWVWLGVSAMRAHRAGIRGYREAAP